MVKLGSLWLAHCLKKNLTINFSWIGLLIQCNFTVVMKQVIYYSYLIKLHSYKRTCQHFDILNLADTHSRVCAFQMSYQIMLHSLKHSKMCREIGTRLSD